MKKYRKLYRIRKKKPIFRNRFFWLILLLLVIFSGIFYLVSFSRFFEVQGSEISGNQKVSSENLENIFKKEIEKKIILGGGRTVVSKSIFLANLNKIKERILNDYPQIAKVTLKRNFPNKISIQIEEREPIAIFCQAEPGKNCFLIDKEGIIIDSVVIINSENLKLAKIIGNIDSPNLGVKVIEKNYLDSILEIQKKLSESQKLEIKEFIPSEKKLTVWTFEDWQIFFDPSGDISDQILNLAIILKEKVPPEKRPNLEYIDLRFENKIYFKPR